MTFEEKVKILRSLPKFKVIPISEVKAIAFAAIEKSSPDRNDYVLKSMSSLYLILSPEDIQKIIREYPDLEAKFAA